MIMLIFIVYCRKSYDGYVEYIRQQYQQHRRFQYGENIFSIVDIFAILIYEIVMRAKFENSDSFTLCYLLLL